MPNVFLISDTHFGHANCCVFLNADGTKMRPWTDVTEMDEAMVERWNSVVKPEDKVYHLGDVFINKKHQFTLNRLNGSKVLIKGNHDIFGLENYLPYFRDIRAYHVLDRFIMSHVPIHEGQLGRFKGNVHGHLHGNLVLDAKGTPDLRYKSVC